MLYIFWSITFQFLIGFECHSQITLQIQIILVRFPKISNSDNVPPLFLKEKMQYFGNKMKPPALQIFAILNQIYEFWQISRRTNIDFITMTSSKVTAQKEEKRAVAETQSITPLLRTEQNIKQLLIFNSRDFSSDKWFGNDSFH